MLIDVLANDAGTGLTLTSAGAPSHGTAVIQGGKILYTAANGWFFQEEGKLGTIEPGKLGDIVVLSDDYFDPAKETAERIRKQVRAEQFEAESVTISIGVAEYPSQGDTAKSVIGQADAALYEAKRAGRDRVVCAVAKSNKKRQKAGTS